VAREAPFDFVATCPRGVEGVLADELRALGLAPAPRPGRVSFPGDVDAAYGACLWSRTASRVLVTLGRSEDAGDGDGLYRTVRDVPWPEVFPVDRSFAVRVVGQNAAGDDPRFLTLRTKDAIADAFRASGGRRPDVDRRRPDVRVQVHVRGRRARVALDLSGDPLHRRGDGGRRGGPAPLKENLAAAILLLADWPGRADAGSPLVDPMCGSGTFLIEAARIARDVAPGLGRLRWGFDAWRAHRPDRFAALVADAERRRSLSRDRPVVIRGYDGAPSAIERSRDNLRAAGLDEASGISVAVAALGEVGPAPDDPPGLVVTNPPYGERLGDEASLGPLYGELGDVLRRRFLGWDAMVLVGNPALGSELGLRPRRRHPIAHGGLDARVLELSIDPDPPADAPRWRQPSADAPMLANRLRKNLRRLRGWLRRSGARCYRVYDRDIPEYALTIERYEDEAVVWEWAAPRSVPRSVAAARRRDALMVVPEALGIAADAVHFKVRSRGPGGQHYGVLSEGGRRKPVTEGPLKLLVNLEDRLDTGLFLDHRSLRDWVRRECAERKRFLNLFAYTCSATVAAAVGGARETTSVDTSGHYLAWGRDNLRLNDVPDAPHRLVQEDVRTFLSRDRETYDLVFCAPPTYARSKDAADEPFDLVRDHPRLIRRCVARLAPGGVLVFSAPTRGFTLDLGATGAGLRVEDRTRPLTPEDFAGRDAGSRIYVIWRPND